MEETQRIFFYRIILWGILIVLICAAVYLYIIGDFFRANVTLVSIGAILLPGFIYRNFQWLQKRYTPSFIRAVEIFVAIAIVFNSFGALGLYYVGLEYDGVLHFYITAFIAFLVMCFVGVLLYRRKSPHFVGKSLFWGSIVAFIIPIVGWEVFEFFGDRWWGTALATDPAQPTLDTWVDIIWDFVGVSAAVIFGYYMLEYFVKKFVSRKQ